MKKRIRMAAVILGLIILTATGSIGSDIKHSGFLGNYYRLLEPGPEGGAKIRWLRPGVDFTKYTKVMLEGAVFFLSDDSDYKGINAEEMKTLSDDLNMAVVMAFQDKYPIVSTPGPHVVRLRAAITQLKQNRPGLSAISSVVPVGIGLSFIKKGTEGSWTGAGATGLELMAIDSMTNEVVRLALDAAQASKHR